MPGNSFGQIFKLTTFGESHGPAIGGVLEGCPAGISIDEKKIVYQLSRRRPGQSAISTPRNETDHPQFLSGIFEGRTTGAPIAFIIPNDDVRSTDYSHLKDTYRPSHADYTYEAKYGLRDHRGGGRSSARETAARVVAGAIAFQFLEHHNVTIAAFVKQIGTVRTDKNYFELDLSAPEANPVRCPDPIAAEKMIAQIEEVKASGDTLGGIIQCVIQGLPAGLGEPVFDKMHALLGHAMLSINAVKGFEIGSGFAGVSQKGSQQNDRFITDAAGKIRTQSNNSGGIQGGISNGMPVFFNVAFKAVSTLLQDQQSINREGNETTVKGLGRHDVCVVPRAVPIVESMAALVTADLIQLRATNTLFPQSTT